MSGKLRLTERIWLRLTLPQILLRETSDTLEPLYRICGFLTERFKEKMTKKPEPWRRDQNARKSI